MTDNLSSNELTLLSPQVMPANEDDNRSEGDSFNQLTRPVASSEDCEDSGSESERISVKKKNNRTKRFSDSESNVDKEENSVENIKSLPVINASSDSDDYTSILKQRSKKSRIKTVKSDSDSDSEQSQLRENRHVIARESPHSTRITEKRNNFKKKLQDLLNSKNKRDEILDKDTTIESEPNRDSGPDSSNDEEIASINEIKKKVKEHRNNLKMSVCDTDTSEDESSHPRHAQKLKKPQKRTKLISPKHQRMSAKQAMENMQKIKSESNRMLREKEVSLPYHRAKALSLKDIMSRRKPAVSSDGKVLPIKMNDEQLRQYALQLEQRQREMMELCKSDSEEDEEEPNEIVVNTQQTGEMSVESAGSASEMNKESETASVVPDNVHNSSSNNITNSENTIDPIIDTNTDIQESVRSAETHCNDSESLQPNETVISNINTDITNVEDNSENVSAEMELVYNDSMEGETLVDDKCLETNEITENNAQEDNEAVDCVNVVKPFMSTDAKTDESVFKSVDNYNASENFTEKDSQLISLRYDTEKTDSETNETLKNNTSSEKPIELDVDDIDNNEFPDNDENDLDDINMEDIDKIIENAEIIRADMTHKNSPALVKDTVSLTSKPKLMGAPGMVIDLDGNDAALPKKLTGVELLKERFTYFAKLKTPEEMERDKEKRQKPGAQHLKLKHELEEKIAEQRSLEWAKRLEGEKEHQKELEAIRGDTSDVEDDIDTIEAKLEEKESEIKASSSSEQEEEEIEDDVLIEDKPRKKNPLVEDEAEESDDEAENDGNDDDAENDGNDDKAEFGEESPAASNKINDESDDDSSNDEKSSESEEEQESKPKKGRILKAFEDSDDDETTPNNDKVDDQPLESNSQHATDSISSQIDKNENQETDKISDVTVPVNVDKVNEKEITKLFKSDSISESQDDDLQLAQVPKVNSEDLFTSQESVVNKPTDVKTTNAISDNNDVDLGSQTFSIMTSNSVLTKGLEMEIGSQEKISVISETQMFDDNLDAVVGMCSGTFSQNYIEFKRSSQSQNVESQAIGDEILEMCTGKFYDNEFVSQPDDNVTNTSTVITQECTPDTDNVKKKGDSTELVNKKNVEIEKRDKDILKSVLDELNEPEFESTKPMKFFFDTKSQNKENEHSENNTQLKKKFVIDSDDDSNENAIISDKKKKKLKKKRLEKRALQISDDEDDEHSDQDCEDLMSENGDDQNNEEDRLVEYDSEENEIEVKPQQKKKRKVADFFEQEAELSSEDEWAGSGDEDEAGLDRMEREEGDDEVFHQGKLQAELGQIHMRDVLDQDKREVRLIQELLFEDGDLGGGGRQRKFRWRNADGEEVDGPLPDELADTQEEEFESEEQWRKQRHEREMFLRQLKSQGEEKDDLNVSITRSTIIKANLLSRTMSSVLEEVNNKTVVETAQLPTIPEKKITKDIPSPKKPFSVFQQNYHGSLLTRGRGALARLAALATPLAVDGDAPKVPLLTTSKRNFVFAAITPDDKQPKVTKRKAETTVGTPRLVKKMRTEDKKQPKSSLLDHILKT